MRERLIVPVALTVLIVWAGAAFFSFLTKEYVPLEVVTPTMIILAGYVFGFQVTRRNGNGNGGKKK